MNKEQEAKEEYDLAGIHALGVEANQVSANLNEDSITSTYRKQMVRYYSLLVC
jgi:hypothetical protein